MINDSDTEDLTAALATACPDGIDVYFDNVGSAVIQAAVSLINYHARIVVCGQASQYNESASASGAIAPQVLIKHSALMQGFVVYDYKVRNAGIIAQLGEWTKNGQLRYRENIVEGLENAPQASIDPFSSRRFDKQLVRLAE